MNKADLDRAFLLGVSAAQTGKRLTDNRFKHYPGREGELLRNAWDDGHANASKPEETHAD